MEINSQVGLYPMIFKTKYGTKLTKKKKQKNTWLTGSLKIKYYFKIFFKKKAILIML
jgi:hypothetical protein